MEANEIHPDQQFISGLLNFDEDTVYQIYRQFSGTVKRFVLTNGGSADDAAAIFRETLIDIFQEVKYKRLRPVGSFQHYFMLLCKRKWLTAIEERVGTSAAKLAETSLINAGGEEGIEIQRSERIREDVKRYIAAVTELNDRCREIIKVSVNTEQQTELAQKLRISDAYFRKKKSECMSLLVKTIQGETAHKTHTDSIARYAEDAMEMQERAYFEQALGTDPELRKQLETYYDIRSTLWMGIARDGDEAIWEEMLSDISGRYFGPRITAIRFKRILYRTVFMAAIAILILFIWAPRSC